jgi:Putative restriction endonuclease
LVQECCRLSQSRHAHRDRHLSFEGDRPGIYAALRVAEVWRFDGERKRILIERLNDDGTYQTVDMSGFLPVRSEEVGRWLLEEDRRDGSAWARRLRAWARAELAPRLTDLDR